MTSRKQQRLYKLLIRHAERGVKAMANDAVGIVEDARCPPLAVAVRVIDDKVGLGDPGLQELRGKLIGMGIDLQSATFGEVTSSDGRGHVLALTCLSTAEADAVLRKIINTITK